MFHLNLLTISLAAISAFVLGFLFHGPLLGKLWMRLSNIQPTGDEKFADMIPKLIWNFVANWVSALGLAVIYSFASTSPLLPAEGIWKGIICALCLWAGFLVTATSIEVIWMGRSIKLWLFESACSLIVMIVMGVIITY